MDDIRDSFSKMKIKFKHRLTGRERKPDGAGGSPGEERADSTSSLPQPESRVVAGESYDREEDGADGTGERDSSTDRLKPESAPVCGSDNGLEGGEADTDGGEAGQRRSYPHPDVEVAVGSEHGGKLERGVHPSPSTPSILHSGKPDST